MVISPCEKFGVRQSSCLCPTIMQRAMAKEEGDILTCCRWIPHGFTDTGTGLNGCTDSDAIQEMS